MIDRVKVTLISGKGGDGKVAFLHEKVKLWVALPVETEARAEVSISRLKPDIIL